MQRDFKKLFFFFLNMLARAPIVLLYANSFYSFDTLMSSLILYSAKNVEILRNKHGILEPNTATFSRGKKILITC